MLQDRKVTLNARYPAGVHPMGSTEPIDLEQVLVLARRLPPREQAHLISHLVEELAEVAPAPVSGEMSGFALPVLTGGIWHDDLPLRREELYGDDECC